MNIKDILPHIKDRRDFVVIEKNNYTIVDYVYMTNDTFDVEERLECRGLKFDNQTGELLARPLHKFFNYMEKPEHADIDWTRPHVVMPKLDGSMVHSCVIDGEVVFMTRMGRTEHAIRAERHLTEDMKETLKIFHETGSTVIFEWTAPDNQIVLKYPESKLTLIAVRREDGQYFKPIELMLCPDLLGVELVEYIETMPSVLLKTYKEETDIEGYVVWFTDDDTFIKMKTDEYVMMHRAVSFFDRKERVLECVLDNKCDDLYPALSKERADKLRQFETEVNKEIGELVTHILEVVLYSLDNELDRKTFAISFANKQPKWIRAAYFNVLDEKDPVQSVKNCMLRNPENVKAEWN